MATIFLLRSCPIEQTRFSFLCVVTTERAGRRRSDVGRWFVKRMDAVERNLTPGERVIYRTGLHWILYVAAFGPAGVAIGGCVAFSLTPDGPIRSAFLILATLALVGMVGQVFATWVKIRATQIVVTNRRVIYASGLLSRRSIEMNRDKVESVMIDQNVTGRLLDFGTVIIRGVGAGLEPVANVIAPLELRRWVGGE